MTHILWFIEKLTPLVVRRVGHEENQDEMHQAVEIRVDHCPDWLKRQEMTHHCDSYQAVRLASEIPFWDVLDWIDGFRKLNK